MRTINKSELNETRTENYSESTVPPSSRYTESGLRRVNFRLLSSVFCLLFFVGCAENKYVLTTDRLCIKTASKEAIITAAEKTLAEMHFTIEKSDVNAGIIRTYPLPGAQSFEFWRADSVGSFNQAEADIQSIRRTVELGVTEQSGELCINCVAKTQRLSMASDEQGTNRPVEIHRSIQKLRPGDRYKTSVTWFDLGRDAQLETEIIKRIEKRLAAKRN